MKDPDPSLVIPGEFFDSTVLDYLVESRLVRNSVREHLPILPILPALEYCYHFAGLKEMEYREEIHLSGRDIVAVKLSMKDSGLGRPEIVWEAVSGAIEMVEKSRIGAITPLEPFSPVPNLRIKHKIMGAWLEMELAKLLIHTIKTDSLSLRFSLGFIAGCYWKLPWALIETAGESLDGTGWRIESLPMWAK